MKIYTKTGDKGETSLFGGLRVPKDSLRVETYGTVDELNSVIGVVIAEIQNSKLKIKNYNAKLKSELERIQSDLFDLGSALATVSSKNYTLEAKRLDKRVNELEKIIDQLTAELPQLQNFILPGGGIVGSQLHFARTVCRRAERRLVSLVKQENVDSEILRYFNRLSDLLFTMARFVNHIEKQKETLWQKQS